MGGIKTETDLSRREGGIRGKQDIGKRKRKEDSRAGFLSGLGAKLRWANSLKGLIFLQCRSIITTFQEASTLIK